MLFSARLSPVAVILRTRPALRDVTPSLRLELRFLGRASLYGFWTLRASTHPAVYAACSSRVSTFPPVPRGPVSPSGRRDRHGVGGGYCGAREEALTLLLAGA